MKHLKDILQEGILSDIDSTVNNMDNDAEKAKLLSWLENYETYFSDLVIEDDNSIFFKSFKILNNTEFDGFPEYIKFSKKFQHFMPAVMIRNCPNFKKFNNFIPALSFLNILYCTGFEGFKNSKIERVDNALNIVSCPEFSTFEQFPECYKFSIRDCNIKNLNTLPKDMNTAWLSLEDLPQLNDISNMPNTVRDLVLYKLPKLKNITIPDSVSRLICEKIKAKPEDILINNPEFRNRIIKRAAKLDYNDKEVQVMLNVGTNEHTFWLGKKFLCTETGSTDENPKGQKYAF